ncbi:MAG: hypothetical protein LBN94_02230 [Puniceicoccales bacterium]|nr:hypothetical protein [Puniceicoccales bacterium]
MNCGVQAIPVFSPDKAVDDPWELPQPVLTNLHPLKILASVPSEDIKCLYRGLSIFRPSCPVKGIQYRTEKNTGVLINGGKFYFNDSTKEREIIEILTEQSRDLEMDVIKNLRLNKGDFGNIRVIDAGNGFDCFLMIKGKSLRVTSGEIYFILNELSKHFTPKRFH